MLSELGSDPRFFARWRSECTESMTLIDVLPEGDLYFYHSQHCGSVWVISGAHSVIVAYRQDEYDIAQVRRKVEFWDRARQDRVRSDVGGEFGGAVYAATEDRSTKRLDVAWFSPGDWLGVRSGVKSETAIESVAVALARDLSLSARPARSRTGETQRATRTLEREQNLGRHTEPPSSVEARQFLDRCPPFQRPAGVVLFSVIEPDLRQVERSGSLRRMFGAERLGR